jgi:hypothetical protein
MSHLRTCGTAGSGGPSLWCQVLVTQLFSVRLICSHLAWVTVKCSIASTMNAVSNQGCIKMIKFWKKNLLELVVIGPSKAKRSHILLHPSLHFRVLGTCWIPINSRFCRITHQKQKLQNNNASLFTILASVKPIFYKNLASRHPCCSLGIKFAADAPPWKETLSPLSCFQPL